MHLRDVEEAFGLFELVVDVVLQVGDEQMVAVLEAEKHGEQVLVGLPQHQLVLELEDLLGHQGQFLLVCGVLFLHYFIDLGFHVLNFG